MTAVPAYLVHHTKGQQGDILIEDPHLTLALRDGWAVFTDTSGTCLAVPAGQIASIQRIDPQHHGQDTQEGPAPQE